MSGLALFFFFNYFLVVIRGSCSDLASVNGFLIDLDGTIYNPAGLIDGATVFYDWLITSNKSFVFLSNSGAKGPVGVQTKLSLSPYKISESLVPLDRCFTAAISLALYMRDLVPPSSYVYFLQSTSKFGDQQDSCIKAINRTIPDLFSTYHWRTDLSDEEVKTWAERARTSSNTFVISCADGQVSDDEDPVTGQPGYTGWSFSLLSKATVLIRNGATYVNHAPDTHNLVADEDFPNVVLNTPGPGTFYDLLVQATYPDSVNRVFTVGKGGNLGTKYAVGPGLNLLKQQGGNGIPSQVAIGLCTSSLLCYLVFSW
eukprot:TRINITY_DN576_c0_g2_i4.p1 TRINITY_DN576_c0_g2~~TRINITY_DN576_c0_g2_i4.p1  ORF type:complete len:314 (+),score=47.11 TRINITY_DN576_c0_g2_i4:84-1025(+)